MTRAEARDWALALDIVWHCDRAVGFVEGLDFAAFRRSELHQAAVERCITVVGEAASKLSPAFRNSVPDVPWAAITGMRHIVVHDYGRVDDATIWKTVTEAMPTLAGRLRPLIPPPEPDEASGQ